MPASVKGCVWTRVEVRTHGEGKLLAGEEGAEGGARVLIAVRCSPLADAAPGEKRTGPSAIVAPGWRMWMGGLPPTCEEEMGEVSREEKR